MATEPEKRLDPRIVFAAERTLLAWIRTGLAMMGFGFVVARFGLFLRELASARGIEPMKTPTPGRMSLWVGVGLVMTGVAVNVVAALQHVRTLRRLERGDAVVPRAISLGTVLSTIMAALGVILAIYLIFVH